MPETKLNCIIVDDEPLALRLLESYIARTPQITCLKASEDAFSAIDFMNKNTVDILFVDINMPDINGIDLVRKLIKRPLIIFTTAHKDYALDGFELEAIDYLLKPIDFNRFSKAVEKAITVFEYSRYGIKKESKSTYIAVYSEYRLIQIDTKDIEYIEAMNDYVKIYLLNGKMILTLSTLKAIADRLPSNFLRVHRSFIVDADQVQSINKKRLLLKSREIAIGETYFAKIKLSIQNRR